MSALKKDFGLHFVLSCLLQERKENISAKHVSHVLVTKKCNYKWIKRTSLINKKYSGI